MPKIPNQAKLLSENKGKIKTLSGVKGSEFHTQRDSFGEESYSGTVLSQTKTQNPHGKMTGVTRHAAKREPMKDTHSQAKKKMQ